MITKTTRLFAMMGRDLSADRTYQMYNYIFETNKVDASFININVPEAKIDFTLQNLHNSEIESIVLEKEMRESDIVRSFFDTKAFVFRIDIKDKKLLIASSTANQEEGEDMILETARLNFFEWFGFFPAIPEDTLKTLKESAPRDSILTRG